MNDMPPPSPPPKPPPNSMPNKPAPRNPPSKPRPNPPPKKPGRANPLLKPRPGRGVAELWTGDTRGAVGVADGMLKVRLPRLPKEPPPPKRASAAVIGSRLHAAVKATATKARRITACREVTGRTGDRTDATREREPVNMDHLA